MPRKYDEDILKEELEKFLKEIGKDYIPRTIESDKAIHDAVHGTQLFAPHEVALIDLPIVQRLRRISQTDVASLVFPTANHNRFEHSIGVATISGQMVKAIYKKCGKGLRDETEILNHVRLAALLHDVGHGPFSHLSEQLYEPKLQYIKKNNPVLRGGKPHEILSYFIIKSGYFQKFNKEIIKGVYGVDIDLDFVGEIVVGYVDKTKRPESAFAVDLINGAFDADKLDYILRDSYSTGLKLSLDIHRLFYTLNVIDVDGANRLSVDMSGVPALEQIIFNKMNLFSIVYHHQKIRAAGCQLRSIILKEKKLKTPVDFLKYDDGKILNLKNGGKNLNDFNNRALPARALLISKNTAVENSKITDLIELFKEQSEKNVFIEKIVNKLLEKGIKTSSEQIWIDLPEYPKFKEAKQCYILSQGAPNGRVLLGDIFPSDQWAKSFSANKWRGYVFADRKIINEVSKSAIEILETDGKYFNAQFNQYATSLCKLSR